MDRTAASPVACGLVLLLAADSGWVLAVACVGVVGLLGCDVAPVVTVATTLLRRALLELLADERRTCGDALAGFEERDVELARAHHLKAVAVGGLLDRIGWVPPDVPARPFDADLALLREVDLPAVDDQPCRVDLALDGWALVEGLSLITAREAKVAEALVEHEENAEEVGDAQGRRRYALRQLADIQAACREAGLVISEPRA